MMDNNCCFHNLKYASSISHDMPPQDDTSYDVSMIQIRTNNDAIDVLWMQYPRLFQAHPARCQLVTISTAEKSRKERTSEKNQLRLSFVWILKMEYGIKSSTRETTIKHSSRKRGISDGMVLQQFIPSVTMKGMHNMSKHCLYI